MDGSLEDLELREAQREYLDFLDDDVSMLESDGVRTEELNQSFIFSFQ